MGLQMVQNDDEENFDLNEKTQKNDDLEFYAKLMRQSNLNVCLEMILAAYTHLIS